MKKRVISVILVLCMIFSLMPEISFTAKAEVAYNDFDSMTANQTPAGWDISGSTSYSAESYLWGVYDYGGNKMLRMYNYMAKSGTAIIDTPALTLGSVTPLMLNFDYSNRANCGEFKVQISEDKQTFTDLGAYANSTGSTDKNNPGTFTSVSIDISAYAGKTVYVRLYADANWGNGAIFFDNLVIGHFNALTGTAEDNSGDPVESGGVTFRVNGKETTAAEPGDAVTATAKAVSGYYSAVLSVTSDGVQDFNADAGTFTMPDAAVTVKATYTMMPRYTLTGVVSPDGFEVNPVTFSINGSPVTQAYEGAAVKAVIQTMPGYYFIVTGTYGETGTENVLTVADDGSFTMPAGKVIVKATYFPMPGYSLTGVVSPDGVGTEPVTFSVNDSPVTEMYEGARVKVSAQAVEGYNLTFSGTYGKDGTGHALTVAADGSFTMPAAPVIVTAKYVEISVSTFPWTEDFNDGVLPEAKEGWTVSGDSGRLSCDRSRNKGGCSLRFQWSDDGDKSTSVTLPPVKVPEGDTCVFGLSIYRDEHCSYDSGEGVTITCVNGETTTTLELPRLKTEAKLTENGNGVGTVEQNGWYTYTIPLQAGTNTITVTDINHGGYYTYVEDFFIRESVYTPATGLTFSNTTSTATELTFEEIEGTAGYQVVVVEQKVANPDFYAFTSDNTVRNLDWTAASGTIDGLTSGKTYYVYVRGKTSSGYGGDWSEPAVISTQINTFPWAEGFNDGADGTVPDKWSVEKEGNGTSYPQYASGALKFPNQSDTTNTITLPQMDIPAEGTYTFGLSVYRSGIASPNEQEGITVIYQNEQGEPTPYFIPRDITVEGDAGTESAAGWYTYSVILPKSGWNTIQIKGCNQNIGDILVDDLFVRENVYDQVTGLTFSDTTPTGTTLTFDAISGAAGYRVVVVNQTSVKPDLYGFTAGNIVRTLDWETNSGVIDGLDGGKKYYVYVCGKTSSGHIGDWSEPATVDTPIGSFPWSETFEDGQYNAVFNKWPVEKEGNGTSYPRYYTFMNHTYNGRAALLVPDQTAGTYYTITLPQVVIPEDGSYIFGLSVYRFSSSNPAAYANEGFTVIYEDAEGNPAKFFIPRCSNVAGDAGTESADGWYTYYVTLPKAGLNTIKLRACCEYGNIICIDDLFICKAMTDGNAYTVDYATETVSAVDENYEIGARNGGNYTILTENTAVVPGGTYYVRAKTNGNGFISDWTAFTVKTRPTAPAEGVGYIVDYSAETINAAEGYEIATEDGGSYTILTENTAVVPGGTYYVRVAATGSSFISDWTAFTVGARPEALSEVSENTHYTVDYVAEQINAAEGYEIATEDGGVYTVPEADATVLPGGTYYVRTVATESSFASEWAAFTVGARPETPAEGVGYIVDYSAETINAAEGYEIATEDGGSYTILTENTAVVPGGTYYVRVAATESSFISDWVTFTVSARPAAPTNADYTLNEQTLTMTNAGIEYEIRVQGSESWESFTGSKELEGGKTYDLRVKANGSSFASESASVTVENSSVVEKVKEIVSKAVETVTKAVKNIFNTIKGWFKR